jgi:hypothetical protein
MRARPHFLRLVAGTLLAAADDVESAPMTLWGAPQD